MKQSILFALMGLLFVGVFLTGCTTANNQEKSTAQTPSDTKELLSAPEFTVTTITGETHSMQEYRESGKPTLVYFMASWCPTCAKNWPSLNKIYTNYNDKVNLVAISIDPTDTKDVLTKLANDKNLLFPIVPGNPKVMIDFGVRGQATTVGIDANGNIQFIKSGMFSVDNYRSMIESLA